MNHSGSDLDIMLVQKIPFVCEKNEVLEKNLNAEGHYPQLIRGPERAQPGFTLIRVIGDGFNHLSETEWVRYVSIKL